MILYNHSNNSWILSQSSLYSTGSNISVSPVSTTGAGGADSSTIAPLIPEKIYFEAGSISYLEKMPEITKAFIVTDESMVKLGYVDKILYHIRKIMKE